MVESSSVQGPWIPCLEPIDSHTDANRMTLQAGDDCKFLRLARGWRFVEDFDDGDLEGWTVLRYSPGAEEDVQVELVDQRLHVFGQCDSDERPGVYFYRTNLILADFAMSIDALGWNGPNNWSEFKLIARLDPEFRYPDFMPLYLGGAAMHEFMARPGYSRFFFWSGLTGQEFGDFERNLFPRTDPGKDYRLVFTGSGEHMTLKLYDLSDGSLVHEDYASDGALTEGWISFAVDDIWGGAVDFTLDNLIVVGTTPE